MPLQLLADCKTKLSKYPNTMYRALNDIGEDGLRTGDVIYLDTLNFKEILRNYNSFKELFAQYEANPKYRANYWAILNKPCDMVHDESKKRKFDTNMFLCPLQSFLFSFGVQEILNQYREQPASVEEYSAVLERMLTKYLKKYFSTMIPITENQKKEEKKELLRLREDGIETVLKSVLSIENVFSFSKSDDHLLVENVLAQYAEEGNILGPAINFFKGLSTEPEWKAHIKTRAIEAGNGLSLTKEQYKLDEFSKFFRNQKENDGLYYYEPHLHLFSDQVSDFSFFLELEDMMTFKIKESSIQDGSFVELLKVNRKVGLTRNFSDRLQNIMGNYFSKIGTSDIKSNDIFSLYQDAVKNFYY